MLSSCDLCYLCLPECFHNKRGIMAALRKVPLSRTKKKKPSPSRSFARLFSGFYFHFNQQQHQAYDATFLDAALASLPINFHVILKADFPMCALDFARRLTEKHKHQVTSAAAKNRINESGFWGAATSTSMALIEGKHAESVHGDTRTATASNARTSVSPGTFMGRLVNPGLR